MKPRINACTFFKSKVNFNVSYIYDIVTQFSQVFCVFLFRIFVVVINAFKYKLSLTTNISSFRNSLQLFEFMHILSLQLCLSVATVLTILGLNCHEINFIILLQGLQENPDVS